MLRAGGSIRRDTRRIIVPTAPRAAPDRRRPRRHQATLARMVGAARDQRRAGGGSGAAVGGAPNRAASPALWSPPRAPPCTPTCAESPDRSLRSCRPATCGPLHHACSLSPQPLAPRPAPRRRHRRPIRLWSALPLGASGASQSQVEGQIEQSKNANRICDPPPPHASPSSSASPNAASPSCRSARRRPRPSTTAGIQTRDHRGAPEGVTQTARASEQRRPGPRSHGSSPATCAPDLRGQPDLATVVIESEASPISSSASATSPTYAPGTPHPRQRAPSARRTMRLERSLNRIVPEQRRETQARAT